MKNKTLIIKILGIYQIWGGIMGIGILVLGLVSISKTESTDRMTIYFSIASIAFLLYCYSIFSGIILIKREKVIHSFVNQLLQIISFSILGYGFTFFSGFYVSTGINLSTGDFLLKWGLSTWEISFNSYPELSQIHINILALLLIFYFDYLRKEISTKTEKSLFDLNTNKN